MLFRSAKFHELKQSLQKTQQLDDTTSTTTVTITYPATTYTVAAPIATVPVYYSTPVYYYDTSVIQPLYVDATPVYVLQ